MPPKGINGRANMQKFQMNSKKYGGNPFKYASLVSSVGRASKGGMWNYIQRRTGARPSPPKITPAMKLLILNTIKDGAGYDSVLIGGVPGNFTPPISDDIDNEIDNGRPQNYIRYNNNIYQNTYHFEMSALDINWSNAQAGWKYKFIILSFDDYAGEESSEGGVRDELNAGLNLLNAVTGPPVSASSDSIPLQEFQINYGIVNNKAETNLSVAPTAATNTDLNFQTFGTTLAPNTNKFTVVELTMNPDLNSVTYSLVEAAPVPPISKLLLINTCENNTSTEYDSVMIIYTSPTADPIIKDDIDNTLAVYNPPGTGGITRRNAPHNYQFYDPTFYGNIHHEQMSSMDLNWSTAPAGTVCRVIFMKFDDATMGPSWTPPPYNTVTGGTAGAGIANLQINYGIKSASANSSSQLNINPLSTPNTITPTVVNNPLYVVYDFELQADLTTVTATQVTPTP